MSPILNKVWSQSTSGGKNKEKKKKKNEKIKGKESKGGITISSAPYPKISWRLTETEASLGALTLITVIYDLRHNYSWIYCRSDGVQ